MEAERKRRKNELITLAKIRESEGDATAIKNKSVAEKYAIMQQTNALKQQLSELTQILGSTDKASEFIFLYLKINR